MKGSKTAFFQPQKSVHFNSRAQISTLPECHEMKFTSCCRGIIISFSVMKTEVVYSALRFHDTCNYCYFSFSEMQSQLGNHTDEVLMETMHIQ